MRYVIAFMIAVAATFLWGIGLTAGNATPAPSVGQWNEYTDGVTTWAEYDVYAATDANGQVQCASVTDTAVTAYEWSWLMDHGWQGDPTDGTDDVIYNEACAR